ncbi:hypothetical protein CXF68_04205 [Tenacibaculum sp. Bg11-29]|uniref:hypothetical protein n=1 Tax=Tenacibaculum sp. Bg11-29 TaxID=2058306 RepID=UPI000C33F03B|nr:hypothetical protein [Tenacibaculum sp. Bg11-29]PKH49953.1 hypothetical protein CXF68_04205 [Tenacibaculum sp. Bg11-29]
MNLLAMHIPCWLIPLLVGVICAILGYLLGRLFGREKNKEELDIWSNKVTSLEESLEECGKKRSALETDLNTCNKNKLNLEADLGACHKTKLALEADLNTCNKSKLNLESDLLLAKSSFTSKAADVSSITNVASSFTESPMLIPFEATLAKAVFGKKIKENDLKIVEGIGPKIEGLFHTFDIKTWKDLGEASIEKCQEVLNSGGDRYRIHKPNTWPKQAKLAYEGKWEELLKWQDELDGGK